MPPFGRSLAEKNDIFPSTWLYLCFVKFQLRNSITVRHTESSFYIYSSLFTIHGRSKMIIIKK